MRILRATFMSLTLLSGACTSTDSPKPDEAVAPPQESQPAFSDGTPADLPPPESAPEVETPSASSETVGELTDPKASRGEPQPETSTAPGGDSYSDVPEIPAQPEVESAGLDDSSSSKGAKKTKSKGRKGKGGAKRVVRYVNVAKLNVRSAPSLKSSVVRQLDFGSEVQVEPQGKFSKIGEGEWVRSKHLTAKAPGKGKKTKAKKKKAKGKAKGDQNSPAQ